MGNILNEADWQNFIYLAIVLTFLLGSLIARREMVLGKILKYLAIWSNVGLTAVILYTYRYELLDIKNRVMSEISPSSVRVAKSGQLVIRISEDGHFYANIKINEVNVRFMVDTGASDIVLSTTDAKRVGINFQKLIFDKAYQTANGKSWGATIRLKELAIGNIKFNNVPASVSDSEMGTSLLGMSFLRQFSKYEFYRDELVLTM
jgi:aspartyl protease family protein